MSIEIHTSIEFQDLSKDSVPDLKRYVESLIVYEAAGFESIVEFGEYISSNNLNFIVPLRDRLDLSKDLRYNSSLIRSYVSIVKDVDGFFGWIHTPSGPADDAIHQNGLLDGSSLLRQLDSQHILISEIRNEWLSYTDFLSKISDVIALDVTGFKPQALNFMIPDLINRLEQKPLWIKLPKNISEEDYKYMVHVSLLAGVKGIVYPSAMYSSSTARDTFLKINEYVKMLGNMVNNPISVIQDVKPDFIKVAYGIFNELGYLALANFSESSVKFEVKFSKKIGVFADGLYRGIRVPVKGKKKIEDVIEPRGIELYEIHTRW